MEFLKRFIAKEAEADEEKKQLEEINELLDSILVDLDSFVSELQQNT